MPPGSALLWPTAAMVTSTSGVRFRGESAGRFHTLRPELARQKIRRAPAPPSSDGGLWMVRSRARGSLLIFDRPPAFAPPPSLPRLAPSYIAVSRHRRCGRNLRLGFGSQFQAFIKSRAGAHQGIGDGSPLPLRRPPRRRHEPVGPAVTCSFPTIPPPSLPRLAPSYIAVSRHRRCGRICLHRKKINISTVLAGQRLGIREVDDGIWLVSFSSYDLGYSISNKGPCSPSTTRSARGCHPCLRYVCHPCVRAGPTSSWRWTQSDANPSRAVIP